MNPSPLSGTSLRGRLLRGLLVVLTALTLAGSAADYLQARRMADASYDQALARTAAGLASRLELERDGDLSRHLPRNPSNLAGLNATHTTAYGVFDEDGRTVAGLAELRQHAAAAPEHNVPVFGDLQVGQLALRVVTWEYAGPEGHGTIVVAETLHEREQAVRGMMRSVVVGNLLLIIVTLAVVWLAVRHAMKPLDALSEDIAQRDADDLSPLTPTHVLDEVRPLVDAANQLMGRVRDAAIAQQAFVSNTAHQLRTPLAGLQTQMELHQTELAPAQQARAQAMLASTRRLTHLTHQMLALARASPQARETRPAEIVELTSIIEDLADSFVDQALNRRIELVFETRQARLMGSVWMIREMIANLVDNALAYTPIGGQVTVRCGLDERPGPTEHSPFVEVEDNGPGIPRHARERVFERYFRLDPDNGSGTGLGLAIVQDVARQHRARIDLSEGAQQRGTRIRISFPPHD